MQQKSEKHLDSARNGPQLSSTHERGLENKEQRSFSEEINEVKDASPETIAAELKQLREENAILQSKINSLKKIATQASELMSEIVERFDLADNPEVVQGQIDMEEESKKVDADAKREKSMIDVSRVSWSDLFET